MSIVPTEVHLTEDAKDSWKFSSTWVKLAGFVTTLLDIFNQLPGIVESQLPDEYLFAMAGLWVLAFIARITKFEFGSKDEAPEDTTDATEASS